MTPHEKKARNILTQFGPRIASAAANSIVPQNRVAGFIGVECAYDPSTGKFGEGVPRFERHHFDALRSIRDLGYYFRDGKKVKTFSGVSQADLKDATDGDLRALASSWGPGQIMGWHVVHDLNCSVGDLKDPAQSLKHVVDLLVLVAKRYILRGDWASVLRIWNTGKPDGTTHNESYISDAEKISAAYGKIVVSGDAESTWTTGLKPEELHDIPDGAHEPESPKPLPEEEQPPVEPIAEVAVAPEHAVEPAVKANKTGLGTKLLSWFGGGSLVNGIVTAVTDKITLLVGLDPATQKLIVFIVFGAGVLFCLVAGILTAVDHFQTKHIKADPGLDNVK